MSFESVDKLKIVQTCQRAIWNYVFWKCQQNPFNVSANP